MLPRKETPSILDIGCRSGVPAMELARLDGGEATDIDTNYIQLGKLGSKVKNTGLSGRAKAINRFRYCQELVGENPR